VSLHACNDYSNYYESVRVELTNVFGKYGQKFNGSTRSARQLQIHVAGKREENFGEDLWFGSS
jgi:hypothetical protein